MLSVAVISQSIDTVLIMIKQQLRQASTQNVRQPLAVLRIPDYPYGTLKAVRPYYNPWHLLLTDFRYCWLLWQSLRIARLRCAFDQIILDNNYISSSHAQADQMLTHLKGRGSPYAKVWVTTSVQRHGIWPECERHST